MTKTRWERIHNASEETDTEREKRNRHGEAWSLGKAYRTFELEVGPCHVAEERQESILGK